jgi:hypothetical protein
VDVIVEEDEVVLRKRKPVGTQEKKQSSEMV